VSTARVVHPVLLLAALCLASPIAAREDDDETYGPDRGEWEFTLGAAGNSDNEFSSGGFSLNTSLGYFLTEGFELGARHQMSYFDADHAESVFAATTRGFLDYNFDLDRFRPYVGINIGGRYGNEEVDETGTLGPEWGLKFFALENTFLVASMEYQWFFEKVDDIDNSADDGAFVYGLGIGFTF
jgi:hypothetical protein